MKFGLFAEYCRARVLVIDSDGAPDEWITCGSLIRLDTVVWACQPHLGWTSSGRLMTWWSQLAAQFMAPGLAAIHHEDDGT